MLSLKKRAKAKLRSRKGETIAETLIALLIASLALLMLAGAVSAASNVVTKSKNAMISYYKTGSSADDIKAKWKEKIEGAL